VVVMDGDQLKRIMGLSKGSGTRLEHSGRVRERALMTEGYDLRLSLEFSGIAGGASETYRYHFTYELTYNVYYAAVGIKGCDHSSRYMWYRVLSPFW